MKHFLRDIGMTFFTVTGASFLYRLFLKRRGPLVRVVVFHDVLSVEWFASLVEKMKSRYHVLSPKDFDEHNFHTSKINVLVTFDDGYASWVDVCLPILAKQNIQAVFFVNSGLIDASKESGEQDAYVQENLYLRTKRKIISWEGIQTLNTAGHTVGGHTKTHRRLSGLQEFEQEREIQEDKEQIEEILQSEIFLFAFPFGNRRDYTPVTREIAREAGYRHVFSTTSSFVDMESLDVVSRVCIPDGCTERELVRFIEGGYDLYAKVKKLCVR